MQIKANGITFNYQVEGPEGAPWVVFSNSLATDLSMWDEQAAALKQSFRVLRYDHRGHGGTEATGGRYNFDLLVADVVGLFDALSIKRAHFVGVSMGGLIGMTAALSHPRLIRSLVLCDTTACYGPGLRPMWEDRIRVAETEGMTAALVDRTMDIWFTAPFHAREKDTVKRVAAMLERSDPRGYVAAIRAIGFVDLTERIAAIRCPTLVVVGEQDPGTPPAMARVIHKRIPDAQLLVLSGAAHCAVVEASDRFLPALMSFLGPQS